MLEITANFFHWLGILLYGGPLVAFSILLILQNHINGIKPWHIDRVYRAWGSGSGLGLGAIFLGGLSKYYIANGNFNLSFNSNTEKLFVVKLLIFGVLWISYTILEIWTLDPVRKLDSKNPGEDYIKARKRMVYHTVLNAILFLTVFVIGFFAVNYE